MYGDWLLLLGGGGGGGREEGRKGISRDWGEGDWGEGEWGIGNGDWGQMRKECSWFWQISNGPSEWKHMCAVFIIIIIIIIINVGRPL